MMRRNDDRDSALFTISVAAELAGMHPQTLRLYERRGLVHPQRTAKNTRRYSRRDVERLQRIQELTELGLNLAGVERVLLMEAQLTRMQSEMAHLQTRLDEAAAAMRREVERTTAIVQNLLDFTRPKDPARKPMNLIKVVEESLALISNKLSLSNITVVKLLNPLPEIQADPAHMKQVFLNLIINACEAMEEGGTLTIRSDYHPDTNSVSMSIRDTGVGIDEKDRARIFDPFFSTKAKGTGLGLSVVNGIVTRHSGKVEIDSAPGKGTDFRVTLPVG